ncbi:MAG: bifunctional 5,10-methylenetetrahydrofolate dehydrogenase/5,10-methenyltetrahydrofolate cyclohydrolase [Erysipelotrichaceae bacterium]
MIIDGKAVGEKIRLEIKEYVDKLVDKPTLAVVVVGNDYGSSKYVASKEKACTEVGFNSILVRLEENVSEEELINEVNKLNLDRNVNGILIQMPLPNHIDSNKVINVIDKDKDVDGFNYYNAGALVNNDECFAPCTPSGIMYLLQEYNVDLTGKNVVIVNRSMLVGKPLASLMLNENATVTVCHSKTKNLPQICSKADILVCGVGIGKYFTSKYVKDGSIVIDVGINRGENGICGDVDFDDVCDKVALITPVPKGVGPMTIAMLLSNTLKAYERQRLWNIS